MKVDEEGNEIWSRTYDGYGSDIGYSIIASQDGNYIICGSEGYTDSGDAAIVLMKVDEYGSQIWKHEYGGKEADIGYQVVETSSNELLIVATSQTEEDYSLNEPCYSQMVLLKTDSEGELLWP